ncbi:MAG TPA: glycosyltransferase family 4 protein [Propionibacteriaceae bacterium]|nr:glycosyltransferase family 4 protein [Propionibacteriaceae bacterium]
MTTLVVTNDFPPRIGGIESFVRQVCTFLDHRVVVLTRTEPDRAATRAFDAALPFPVHRLPGPLLPTASVRRASVELMRSHGADSVVFGAAAPLGLLAGELRRAGAGRIVALSHGHEVWWSRVPAARSALRRIAREVDVLGVISSYTRGQIGAVLPAEDRSKLVMIPPPVDLAAFTPAPTRPAGTVLVASRLVRQKGVDRLLEAWPFVTASAPHSRLVIAGDGPDAASVRRRAASLDGVEVRRPVEHDRMPDLLRSASVFVSPVRTRLAGLYAEGLGLVTCEAAACGLPVVVGRSGGAPETVLDGVSGSVVDVDDRQALADAVLRWVTDPAAAGAAGVAGRRHVDGLVGSERVRDRLLAALARRP